MGKSDQIVFQKYYELTHHLNPKSVALLGFSSENAYTNQLPGVHDLYDLSLGNWEINSDWKLKNTYDLIVCTRCPYFAKDPHEFIRLCIKHTNPGGAILLDWGLGDHWRFPKYKVGWVRDGEHEFAYAQNNKLYSCMWRKSFEDDKVVKKYRDLVAGRFGYPHDIDLTRVVNDEIPSVVDYECDEIRFECLWPDAPQLYIMTLTRVL